MIPMAEPNRCNLDGLAFSQEYAATMEEVILPAVAARCAQKNIPGFGGRNLRVYRYTAKAPRGTVVLVHGFTENAPKFAEVIHSLLANQWSVLAYDQRGHGYSWRADGLEDLSLTHVDHFDDYVRDLEIVCETMLKPMPRPWVVFAHSMGGAVTARFLELHADTFARAALCAPMIAANRGGMPFFLTKLICRVNQLAGRGKKRVFVSKPYAGPEDFDTSCASSRERFDWYDALKARIPQFHNNGPTYTWLVEALQISQVLLWPGAVERVRTPVRLYTAESDNQVLPRAQEMFVKRLKEGERVFVKGAKHEIYRSTDDVLFPWWHDVLTFLDKAR